MSSILQEVFSSMNVIKSSASEAKEVKKFDNENRRLLKITLKRELIKHYNWAYFRSLYRCWLGTCGSVWWITSH